MHMRGFELRSHASSSATAFREPIFLTLKVILGAATGAGVVAGVRVADLVAVDPTGFFVTVGTLGLTFALGFGAATAFTFVAGTGLDCGFVAGAVVVAVAVVVVP